MNDKELEIKAPLFHYMVELVVWLWKQPFHGIAVILGVAVLITSVVRMFS